MAASVVSTVLVQGARTKCHKRCRLQHQHLYLIVLEAAGL